MNVPSADSPRRYGSRSEVQDLVHQFHPSGLSITDFAAYIGVHPMSVRRWIRISSTQASGPDSKPRFIPVQLRQPDVAWSQDPAAEIFFLTHGRGVTGGGPRSHDGAGPGDDGKGRADIPVRQSQTEAGWKTRPPFWSHPRWTVT